MPNRSDSTSIRITNKTQRTLWELKEKPADTYDEIIRELLVDARDIDVEVRFDE